MEGPLTREQAGAASVAGCAQARWFASQPVPGEARVGDPKLASPPCGSSSSRTREPRTAVAKACWNTSDLELRLTAAIAERTKGRLQALTVRVLGERTVLSGLAGSYHTVQIAVACLLETLSALDLDHPEQIDLNIEVLPHRAASPGATTPR